MTILHSFVTTRQAKRVIVRDLCSVAGAHLVKTSNEIQYRRALALIILEGLPLARSWDLETGAIMLVTVQQWVPAECKKQGTPFMLDNPRWLEGADPIAHYERRLRALSYRPKRRITKKMKGRKS